MKKRVAMKAGVVTLVAEEKMALVRGSEIRQCHRKQRNSVSCGPDKQQRDDI